MNRSRILERNIIIKLLRRNLGDNVYARKAYSYYKTDFVRFIAAQQVEDVSQLYRVTFAEFLSELVENRANLLGTGSLLSLLLLIARNKLSKTENSTFSEELHLPPYQDSELLLYFLRSREEFPLAEHYLVEQFRTSSENVLKSKQVKRNEWQEGKIQELIDDALNTTLDHIRNDHFKPPLSATIFTYYYRVLQNRIKDWNKSAEKRRQHFIEELPDHLASDDPSEEHNTSLIELFQTRYASLRRYDFDNHTQLIETLLNKLEEECQKLLKMFYLEGYDYKEIENILGIQHAKVKTHRCKKTLRNRLDDMDHG